MDIREGESVGDYISRLEQRVRELEPPEGFTLQEWHIGQVYTYLLWRDDKMRSGDPDAIKAWGDRVIMFEDRFAEPVKKFASYMGWDKKDASAASL